MDPRFFADPDPNFENLDPDPDFENLDPDPSVNKLMGSKWCFWLRFRGKKGQKLRVQDMK